MNLPKFGALTGKYEASSSAELFSADIDVVIGHEFGAPKQPADLNENSEYDPKLEYNSEIEDDPGPGTLNLEIARIIAADFADKPIYAPESVARALDEEHGIQVTGLLVDTSSNTGASEGGTWEELTQVSLQFEEGAKIRSIHVGQAHHIGRIARQARLMGFDPLLPPGLPTEFDPDSSQWWCRSVWAWALREIPGSGVLYLKGHL